VVVQPVGEDLGVDEEPVEVAPVEVDLEVEDEATEPPQAGSDETVDLAPE
jgi:hypothetical protein